MDVKKKNEILLEVFDLVDVPPGYISLGVDDGSIAHLFFQPGAGHRDVNGYIVLATENFVITDDTKAFYITIVILHLDPGTKEYFTFLLGSIIDDLQLLKPLG